MVSQSVVYEEFASKKKLTRRERFQAFENILAHNNPHVDTADAAVRNSWY